MKKSIIRKKAIKNMSPAIVRELDKWFRDNPTEKRCKLTIGGNVSYIKRDEVEMYKKLLKKEMDKQFPPYADMDDKTLINEYDKLYTLKQLDTLTPEQQEVLTNLIAEIKRRRAMAMKIGQRMKMLKSDIPQTIRESTGETYVNPTDEDEVEVLNEIDNETVNVQWRGKQFPVSKKVLKLSWNLIANKEYGKLMDEELMEEYRNLLKYVATGDTYAMQKLAEVEKEIDKRTSKERRINLSSHRVGVKRLAYVRKTPGKNEWCVYSETGRNMGCSNSEKGAKKRLRQVEYFKHKKGEDAALKEALADIEFFVLRIEECLGPIERGVDKTADVISYAQKIKEIFDKFGNKIPKLTPQQYLEKNLLRRY